MKYFLLIISVCSFAGGLVNAQNRNYYNKAKTNRIESIQYSKKIINDLKESNENQLEKLLIAKEQLRKQREVLSIINREMQLLNIEIQQNESRIENLKSNLTQLKKEYSDLLFFAYLNIGIQNRMIYIVSAENFNKAYKRILYLKHLTDYRKSRFYKIEESLNQIDSSNLSLKKLSTDKVILAKEKLAQVDSLEIIRKSLNTYIGSTNAQISSINAQVKEEEIKKVEIKQSVTRQIEIDNSDKSSEVSNKSSKLDVNLNKKFINNKKWLLWPLQKYVVIHRFGDYYHPELKDIVVKNDGIVLGASAGSYVHSVFEGKVVNILPIPGSGLSVIVKHGNYYSVYSNVESVKVKTGDMVKKGQVIAALGKSKVNKMIFQLWVSKENSNPEKLDPELWLKKQ